MFDTHYYFSVILPQIVIMSKVEVYNFVKNVEMDIFVNKK
jgi:hypothetical protein